MKYRKCHVDTDYDLNSRGKKKGANRIVVNRGWTAIMYILPPIVNSEAVQKLPSELTDLAIEWLRELKPKKEIKE